jgi:hypothetical protein
MEHFRSDSRDGKKANPLCLTVDASGFEEHPFGSELSRTRFELGGGAQVEAPARILMI